MITIIQNLLLAGGTGFIVGATLALSATDNKQEIREIQIVEFQECQDKLKEMVLDEVKDYVVVEHNFSEGVHVGSF